jgi:integrase
LAEDNDLRIRLVNEAAETDADKLPVIRFHDLRGSTASLLYELGEDPWTIASILGHATPQTGQDHYIKQRLSRQDGAILKMDQKFKKTSKNGEK